MYARYDLKKTINDVEVSTYTRNIVHGNDIITIEAGTTGAPKAKNAKTQATTYIMFATNNENIAMYGSDEGIKLEITGNQELKDIIKVLKFALNVLEDQNNKVDD